ncbi:Serine/threonine-protein kinase PknB [Rosistilla oblonga]|uniref:mitogen-activated protein kinase kinase n=2 Tax=Rosistilla TaxID=2795779 RepID=A0A518IN65_9BACT|nr:MULTISPECIES: serine/threonine-protein kinase [Rosistilla]QDS86384.1 Serine/threonine-protein kinase PknB [Rosistilla ulvae]QDV10592.1 Serine/threonine-protein kinase PknB [Rosistilla oblonga]QDV54524.1 Serine/threonine-protein kinase PknB [Rosistilla oblonga]
MAKARDFFGSYRLTRLIRMGSACQVWEAINETDQKRYALKVLRDELRGDKAEVAGLKYEYDVATQVGPSPRLIKIHDFVTDPKSAYLVLELFSELNMKQALRHGPDSLAYMLNKVVEQSAEGLYFMHTKGWLHCDIKPDNFLVSREGVVKLIDFQISQKKKTGLSKLFGKKSQIQGTRSYMSPEQIRGKNMDERSDIYSYGCVLYEVATGKPPYTGESPNDLLNKHLSAPIPTPLTSNENVSQDFADLIKRMLSKKPEHRPESMWEFLKLVRGMRLFKKQPKKLDVDVFDVASGFKSPEDLLKH